MKLYFKKRYGEQFIGNFTSLKDAVSAIYFFCKSHEFTVPYVRFWNESPNVRYYDFGSWSEFFRVEKTDEEDFADF